MSAKARVPRAGDDRVQAVDRRLRLAGIGEREAEVAVRLRLVRRELEHALEDRHGGRRLAGLLQAVGEQAQHLAVLQVELGEVGERAQALSAAVAVALARKNSAASRKKPTLVSFMAALVEVDARPLVGARGLQALERGAARSRPA